METKKNWTINKVDKVIHITPNDDLFCHIEDFSERGLPICRCNCKPKVEYTANPRSWIITHNSFDGREGVEWVTEMLKNE